MVSPESAAKEIIHEYFDCSDDRNVGKGNNGGLSKSEIRAVYQYTGQSGSPASAILNPILRHISKLPENKAKEYLETTRRKIGVTSLKVFIEHLDSAISKIDLPENLVLYRGVDYEKVIADLGMEIKKGTKFREPAYMSTSYAEEVAHVFSVPCIFEDGEIERKPIFVITTKAGQTGSVSHNECEVILPRKVVCKCLDIIDVRDRRYFIMDYITVDQSREV
jgi:hypothetical protein